MIITCECGQELIRFKLHDLLGMRRYHISKCEIPRCPSCGA